MTLDRHNVVYVDVDGTLLFWPTKPGRVPRSGETGFGRPPELNAPLVEQLRRWHHGNRFLAFWSRGGRKHCEMAARLTGLKPDACLPKPEVAIDDGPRSITAGNPKGFEILPPT